MIVQSRTDGVRRSRHLEPLVAECNAQACAERDLVRHPQRAKKRSPTVSLGARNRAS